MDSRKAHLRMLLNDIHVDLGLFLNQHINQNNFASDMSLRLSDLKERLANLDNANKKYQLDHITQDIEKFVNTIQRDILLDDRDKLTRLQEMSMTLMTRLSEDNIQKGS